MEVRHIKLLRQRKKQDRIPETSVQATRIDSKGSNARQRGQEKP